MLATVGRSKAVKLLVKHPGDDFFTISDASITMQPGQLLTVLQVDVCKMSGIHAFDDPNNPGKKIFRRTRRAHEVVTVSGLSSEGLVIVPAYYLQRVKP